MSTDRNVYQLSDEYTVYGQQCRNVYFYQIGAALSFDAQDLVEDWIAEVLPSVRAVQPANVIHTRVSAFNLFDPTEAGEVLHSLAGTNTSVGQPLPPMIAAAFTLARDTPATRSGKKRVYAGGEAVTVDGAWEDSTFLAALATLAGKMAATITVTLVQRWFPVIVKRIVDGLTYRLPVSQSEATVNGVAGGLVSSIVSTQNTRKIGVGS